MPAAVRSRSYAAFPIAAALLLCGCAVAAPGAENDEWIESAMQEDLDAGLLDAEIDPGLLEPPIDPGSVLPPFGVAGPGAGGGEIGGAAGGTTGGVLPAPRDASTAAPRDAAAAAPRDAGPPRTTTPPRDAGRPATGAAGGAAASTCNVLTCTNTCSVAGPFPCCNILGTCGCTWAPGAYCL